MTAVVSAAGLRVEPEKVRVRVLFEGHEIADSREVLVATEPGRPIVRFFPRKDVWMVFLRETNTRAYSPSMGKVRFYTIYRDQKIVDDCAWSIEEATAASMGLADHVAFLSEHFDFQVEGRTVSETEALGFLRRPLA